MSYLKLEVLSNLTIIFTLTHKFLTKFIPNAKPYVSVTTAKMVRYLGVLVVVTTTKISVAPIHQYNLKSIWDMIKPSQVTFSNFVLYLHITCDSIYDHL